MPTSRDIYNTLYDGTAPNGSHTQTNSIASATEITIPSGATRVVMQCATQNVRYTLDGTTPTTTLGFLITKATDPIEVYVKGCTLTVIEVATTAVLDYQFF